MMIGCILYPTLILHGYLRLTPLQNKPPSFPSEMVFRRYYGNRRFGGGGNAAYWRGRRAAAAAARRRKRFSPFTRYGRALQVGRAATRQALQHFKQVDGTAWPEYRKQKFDMSALTGVGDYAFSKRVTPSVGARIGAWAGDKFGNFLGRITGLGDYEASAVDPMPNINPPVVRNASDRSVIISHREYIGDVVTSATPGAFNLMNFMVNPGNDVVFPWLSRVAACFQEYTLNGCLFQFKSMSADALNSTNTALGQVICATNYNVSQGNYQSKFEMENTEFGSSCKPSESFMHPIECDRRMNVMGNMYIAAGGVVPPGSDPQFYNHCNFQIATNGFQGASVNVGELWVTYEVILRKPIQPEAQGMSGGLSMVAFGQTGNMPANDPITAALWFRPSAFVNYAFPERVMAPGDPTGLDYYFRQNAARFQVVAANGPATSTNLVGRFFQFTASLFLPSGNINVPNFNVSTSSNMKVAATKSAPPSNVPNGGYWQGNNMIATKTVEVTGPGILEFWLDPTPSSQTAQPGDGSYWMLQFVEVPAQMYGSS